jgi:hypothetical protein
MSSTWIRNKAIRRIRNGPRPSGLLDTTLLGSAPCTELCRMMPSSAPCVTSSGGAGGSTVLRLSGLRVSGLVCPGGAGASPSSLPVDLAGLQRVYEPLKMEHLVHAVLRAFVHACDCWGSAVWTALATAERKASSSGARRDSVELCVTPGVGLRQRHFVTERRVRTSEKRGDRLPAVIND